MSGGPASPLPSWLVRLNNARELWAEFQRDRDSEGIAQPTPSENINGK